MINLTERQQAVLVGSLLGELISKKPHPLLANAE
jgi:hypothetical protein